ncbi:MAG: hypothetical protein ACRDZ6_04015 [Acidimicrobiales bacterium]
MRILIADLWVSPHVRAKIIAKHNVTEAEVREAFVLNDRVQARWDFSEEHDCWRILAVSLASRRKGDTLKVALYPVDEMRGLWRLGTAFRAK